MNVILGLAAIRGDDEILELCRRASEDDAREVFSRIIIVDSLGSKVAGALEREFDRKYIHYYNHRHNLGAAGNLAKRLQLAVEAEADYLFALNADGHLDLEAVSQLISHAETRECGAVYPARRLADDCYELTGLLRFPWRPVRRRENELPVEDAVPVFWSSSNGALYALQAAAAGILPPAGLWHGFEDLAYGLLLEKAGYTQVLLPSVRVESRYEVRDVGTPTSTPSHYSYVSDKPGWLAYYTSRNLLLIATRVVPGPLNTLAAIARIALEVLVTLLYRDSKLERLRYLARGLLDGLRGRQGMVVKPPLEA